VGPALFPVLNSSIESRRGALHLELHLPSDFPGCAAYFHLTRATLAAVPLAIGHPKAVVVASVDSHQGSYEIRCPRSGRGVFRLGRTLRALLSTPKIIDVISQQEAAARQAFELAAESQSQFRRMLAALPDAVVVHRDDHIVYANRMLADLLGYARVSELIGKRWSALVDAQGDPDDSRVDVAGKHRLCREDGGEVVLELSPSTSIDYEGAPAELLVCRDVTGREELDKKLALADRMVALGALAAGIAHEINNPLALVIGNLELAQRRPEDTDELLRAATEGAARVRDIVRDLSIFSRPEPDQPVAVDLREVAESSVSLVRGKVRPRATLVLDVEAVPPVVGSRGRFGQVLLNLILNALDALPAERPAKDNQILVRLRPKVGGLVLEVQDNGVGIPAEVQPRLFEPFFTTRRGGSGLGLAVAHDIVASAGGSLVFHTVLGEGTTFRVELPASSEPVSPSSPGPSPRSARQGRILIVDDELPLLRLLQAALGADGHDVDCATSGNEAIRRLGKNGSYDVVLCDLMMPDGSGADVVAYLSARDLPLASRVVLMTGGTYRPETRAFLGSVPNRCLEKPFRLEEVTRAVSEVLAGSE